MVKLVILLGISTESDDFLENWPRFLHEAEAMPGLRKEASSHIDAVVFGAFPYSLIHELYFDTREDLQAALNSIPGRQAGKILQFLSHGNVVILITDHKEDDSTNLARYRFTSEDETPPN
jgi:hypothetical protein